MSGRRDPDEVAREIKARLAGLKRRRRFVPWGESRRLADELDELLYDIDTSVGDPRGGAELTAAFYETDNAILGNCDDSSGYVGDVYRLHALEAFVGFAAKCADKKWLGDLVLKLNRGDDYGVRDALVDCAAEYLPEPEIRLMIARLQDLADSESERSGVQHWLHLVESLARQLGDAPLFEKTRRASWGRLPTAACVDIAEVYLEAGDAEAALSWLGRIPVAETFQQDERDALLLRVHGERGDSSRQAEVAWRMFRRARSEASLNSLVAVLGEGRRDEVVAAEVQAILDDPALSYADVGFLIEMEQFDAAEIYLLDRADRIDGDYYDWLLPVADAMAVTAHPLAASVVYRALIESILEKARSKIYHYAVRYLKRLDLLSPQVSDWKSIPDHAAYLEHLQAKHGRKTSFWSRYGRAR